MNMKGILCLVLSIVKNQVITHLNELIVNYKNAEDMLTLWVRRSSHVKYNGENTHAVAYLSVCIFHIFYTVFHRLRAMRLPCIPLGT